MTQMIKFAEGESFEESMALAIREGYLMDPDQVRLMARDIAHDVKTNFTMQNLGLDELYDTLSVPPRKFHTGNLDKPHLLTGPAYKPQEFGRLLTDVDEDEILIPNATEFDILGWLFGKEHEA